MGKVVPRVITSSINHIVAEMNVLLESRDYDLISYYMGSGISFIRHGAMVQTVQLQPRHGHRVLVTVNTPLGETKQLFNTTNQIKEVAEFIVDSFVK